MEDKFCCSLYEYFTKRLTESRSGLDYFGRVFSADSVVKSIDICAAYLKSIGVKKGDVVSIQLPNIPEIVFSFYAINKIGAIASMLHPMLPETAIIDSMASVGSKWLFALRGTVLDSSPDIKVINCDPCYYLPKFKRIAARILNKNAKCNNEELSYPYRFTGDFDDDGALYHKGDTAVLLHSGGTTGEPKIIKLTAEAMNVNANMTEALPDCVFNFGIAMCLPLFHGFGLCATLHTFVGAGCRGYLMPKFDSRRLAKLIKKGKVGAILGVPSMFNKLVKEKDFVFGIKNVKMAFCGGDTLPVGLKQEYDQIAENAKADTRLFQGYGLAETVAVCICNRKGYDRLGSIGKPTKYAEVKIVGSNGESLGVGEKGEIAVRADSRMIGYFDGEDAGDWILTGDIGYLDSDGFVYFCGRKKRIVVIGGMNIYPIEIERAALTVQGIKEVAAVPALLKGKQSIALYVVKDDKMSEEFAKSALIKQLKSSLIKYAIPRKIVFIEKLPLTKVGKVDVSLLNKMAETE